MLASPSAEASRLLKTGPGYLRTLFAYNASAADRWLVIYDGLDNTGTLIAGPFPIPSKRGLVLDFTSGDLQKHGGLDFTVGCWVASSTSDGVFALGGADFRFNWEVV